MDSDQDQSVVADSPTTSQTITEAPVPNPHRSRKRLSGRKMQRVLLLGLAELSDGSRKHFPRRKEQRVLLLSLAGLSVVGIIGGVVLLLTAGVPRVTAYTVHAQLLASAVGGGGLTYPVQTLDVAYPVSAQVLKVNVQVGQMVQPGQSLLTLDSAGLNAQLEEAYTQWQIAQNYYDDLIHSGASSAQIAAAEQQVEVAKSRYDALNQQINSPSFNNGNIVAMFSGIVTAVNVYPGTLFTANTVLLTLQDLSTIIVRAQFPLEQRAQVQEGSTAEVEPASTPGQRFTGKVMAINPALSSPGSATFEAWIQVPNPDVQLFSGESVYVRIHSQQKLPTVPELTVINPESDSFVFIYASGRVHIRHVVIGVRDGDLIGIVNGLRPGDKVILVGQDRLSDNERVILTGTRP